MIKVTRSVMWNRPLFLIVLGMITYHLMSPWPALRAQEAAGQVSAIQVLLQEGNDLHSKGEYTQALVKFQDALRLIDLSGKAEEYLETKAQTYLLIADCHFKLDDAEATKTAFLKYLELKPDPEQNTDFLMILSEGIGSLWEEAKAVFAAPKAAETQPPLGTPPAEEPAPVAEVKTEEKKQTEEKAQAEDKTQAGKETETEAAKPPAPPSQPVVKTVLSQKPQTKKGGFPWLILVGLAAGGAAAALLLGKKETAESLPVSTTGTLAVWSAPTGAKIYLNGADTGYVTNQNFTKEPGSYTIKLIKEGYSVEEYPYQVSTGNTTSAGWNLKKHSITVEKPGQGETWYTGQTYDIRWASDGSPATGFLMPAALGAALDGFALDGGVASLRRDFHGREGATNEGQNRSGRPGLGLSKGGDGGESGKAMLSHRAIMPGSASRQSAGRDNPWGNRLRPIPPSLLRPQRLLALAPLGPRHTPANSWTPDPLILSKVAIELYKGGALKRTIVSSTANDGSYPWKLESSLPVGTDYRIRIKCDTDGSVYGQGAAFTIKGRSLTVRQPSSGAVWYKGDSHSILWTSAGITGDVKIELYRGQNKVSDLSSKTANNGSFSWTIPNNLSDSDSYWIKITSLTRTDISGASDPFSIIGRSIHVTRPAGGASWLKGESYSIEWTSEGISGGVKIILMRGGSNAQVVSPSTGNDGSFIWKVPANLSDASDYRIKIQSLTYSSIWDQSDAFTITSKPIDVTKPTAGEIWTMGRNYDIVWKTAGSIPDVRIDLYRKGRFVRMIRQTLPNAGIYRWSVALDLAASTDYKIRVSQAGKSSVYGESAAFEIKSPAADGPGY